MRRLALLAFLAVLGACARYAETTAPTGNERTYSRSVEQVRSAVVKTLTELGFEVTTNEPELVTAKRPIVKSIFSSRGGETVRIEISSVQEWISKARITTDLGSEGEVKNWDEEILAGVSKSLR